MSSVIGAPVYLSPQVDVIVAHIVPAAIGFILTAVVIHMNGYVGVIDFENMQEVLVIKRKGTSVRKALDASPPENNQLKSTKYYKQVSGVINPSIPWCFRDHKQHDDAKIKKIVVDLPVVRTNVPSVRIVVE